MKENCKIHFYYIIGIALTIIIILLTKQLGTIEGLVDYITFGLTLSALLLSLISIIYAIISNTSFLNNVSSLNNAAGLISESSGELQNITSGLKEKIECLPSMMTDMGTRIETKLDKDHKELKDALEKSTANTAPSGQSPDNLINKETGGEEHCFQIADFLGSISIVGLFVLYACKLSFEKRMPFDSGKLWASVKYMTDDTDYPYGMLITLVACKVIDCSIKDRICVVNYLQKDLIAIDFPKLISIKLEITFPDYKKEEIDVDIKETVGKIDAYFAE
jgi:hypothetical protein